MNEKIVRKKIILEEIKILKSDIRRSSIALSLFQQELNLLESSINEGRMKKLVKTFNKKQKNKSKK